VVVNLATETNIERLRLWSITSPDAVWYRIDASRSAEAANRLLGNYAGTVVVDGYKSYTSWWTSQMSRGEPHAE
jgi:hypothetical protein